MATYFISDLHLSPAQEQVTAGFLGFLKSHITPADTLYILGDFFDAWIGDDDDSNFASEIKAALKEKTDCGVPVYFIHGNRDFLVGQQFANETGTTLLDEITSIDLYGQPCLIMHGDTLCTQDKEYLQFRQMVRNPAWQQQVLALPLPQRRQMAADLRSKSKSLNAIKASDIMDVTPSEVELALKNAKLTLLIHGHTHRPNTHTLEVNGQTAKRIVLGDWHNSGWYIKADQAGEINLVEFPIN